MARNAGAFARSKTAQSQASTSATASQQSAAAAGKKRAAPAASDDEDEDEEEDDEEVDTTASGSPDKAQRRAEKQARKEARAAKRARKAERRASQGRSGASTSAAAAAAAADADEEAQQDEAEQTQAMEVAALALQAVASQQQAAGSSNNAMAHGGLQTLSDSALGIPAPPPPAPAPDFGAADPNVAADGAADTPADAPDALARRKGKGRKDKGKAKETASAPAPNASGIPPPPAAAAVPAPTAEAESQSAAVPRGPPAVSSQGFVEHRQGVQTKRKLKGRADTTSSSTQSKKTAEEDGEADAPADGDLQSKEEAHRQRVQEGAIGLTHEELLADKRYNDQELAWLKEDVGLQFIKGRFTKVESDAILTTIRKWCQDNGVSEDAFVTHLDNGKKRKDAAIDATMADDLWPAATRAAPGRPYIAVRRHVRERMRPSEGTGKWKDDEVERLAQAVAKHGEGSWSKIAAEVGRTPLQCKSRWRVARDAKNDNARLNKANRHNWTAEEDELLLKCVKDYCDEFGLNQETDEISWKTIAARLDRGVIPHQCLRRYSVLHPRSKALDTIDWKRDVHTRALIGK